MFELELIDIAKLIFSPLQSQRGFFVNKWKLIDLHDYDFESSLAKKYSTAGVGLVVDVSGKDVEFCPTGDDGSTHSALAFKLVSKVATYAVVIFFMKEISN